MTAEPMAMQLMHHDVTLQYIALWIFVCGAVLVWGGGDASEAECVHLKERFVFGEGPHSAEGDSTAFAGGAV